MSQVLTIQPDKQQLQKLILSFKRLGEAGKIEIKKGLGEAAEEIAQYARDNHRYLRRSSVGLERHTTSELFEGSRLGARAFINDQEVPYGKWIHGGFKSWKPDKFLFKAADKKEKTVFTIINEAIERTIEKAGF